MNYESILKQLRPTHEEIDAVNETAEKVIGVINDLCEKGGIDAKANAVGSVAKNTWLRGKSDIDIFISFPIETKMDDLKEIGLDIAYKTNDALNGNPSEHYAVDRTILHTKYIQGHLRKDQEDEVLLLKKFMDAVGTYGSEFKTGGFAGYLCELLILKYGTFEKTLRAAQNWKKHTEIDLEGYGTKCYF